MERLEGHLLHDFEPTNVGALALRHIIDELFAESDREVARICNEGMQDGTTSE